MTISTVSKIQDYSKPNDEGVYMYNFCIDTTEGDRLYIRQKPQTLPVAGDKISFDIKSERTSAQGNPYKNIENLCIMPKEGQPQQQQPSEPSVQKAVTNELKKTGNYVNPNLVMFATGITGRSMQSGRFTKDDISELTRLSVQAFKQHIE